MSLNFFDYYIIGINILGFILFAINTWLYNNTSDKEIDKFITVVSFLGGSLGIVLSILVFDRKGLKGGQKKEIMMSRVFIASLFIIQLILFLIIKGYIKSDISPAFWNFFDKHKLLLIYIVVINLITFIVFGLDKHNAEQRRSRIRIVTLLTLSFIGGSIGGLIAMYLFHHKTKKDYFTVGLPLMIIMQALVIFYLMNGKLL
jgi:uncharacterized membrane protein YsdA (DUF1294 family)